MKLLNKLLDSFNRKGQPKYAIQMIVKGGVPSYLPVIKEPGFMSRWIPIVQIYDKYIPMEFEKQGGLTQSECIQHIEAYKKQFAKEQELAMLTVNYLPY